MLDTVSFVPSTDESAHGGASQMARSSAASTDDDMKEKETE
jgi:hypothetical protein